MITNSEKLLDNVPTVREAINQMIRLRFLAATIVRDKIQRRLLEMAKHSVIQNSVEIPDLGAVEILKISDLKRETEEIDKKFVHRLLTKQVI
jgi:hypothetical protein